MKLNAQGAWELRRGRSGVVRSGVAALVLAVAGAYLGGMFGRLCFFFFGLALVVLAMRFAAVRPLAVFDRRGVTVCGLTRDDVAQSIPWTAVRGITLWSHGGEGGAFDCLTVETAAGLSLVDVDADRSAAKTSANSAPLIDCDISVSDVRAILGGLREQGVPVADIEVNDRRAVERSHRRWQNWLANRSASRGQTAA